jgi:flagellar basal body-associated protein FliL
MELLLIVALLACPVGMVAMMWWMGRMNQGQNAQSAAPVATSTTDASVDELRDEHARLTAQIDQLERQERAPTAAVRARS